MCTTALSRLAALALVITFLPHTLHGQSKRSDLHSYRPSPPLPPASLSSSLAASGIQADPVFATMFGGSGLDEMWDHDISGDYMCFVGITSSPDLTLFRPIQPSLSGPLDGVIGCTDVKTGVPYFITYFGGDSLDVVAAIDILGDTLYAVGWTRSDSLVGTTGMYQETKGGESDCFVTKMSVLDAGGLRTTFFGREGTDECSDIVAGPFGAWIVGTTDGMIDLVDPIQDEVKGPSDAFFSYLDLDLTDLDFSTLFGSDGSDGGTTIGAAPVPPDTTRGKTGGRRVPDFHIVYGGWTQGHNLPVTEDAYQSGFGGGTDMFFGTILYNSEDESSEWIFGTYSGGLGDELPEALAVNRHFAVFAGWTNTEGLNTVGRPYNDGLVDAFAMGTRLPFGKAPLVFGYAGPSNDFNLGLAVDGTLLGTVAVGGFASVPGVGNAFTDVYNVSGDLLQTSFTGGGPPADCLTLKLDYGHISCGGRTAGEVFTTPDAFQRSYGGGQFDMHGSIHALEVSYSHVFNMSGTELTGTFNGRELKQPIAPRTSSRMNAISWISPEPWSYLLSGNTSYRIDHQPTGEDERLIFSYVFDDRIETVIPPTIPPGSGELGILAYNDLQRPIEVIRTDQTTEHTIIKQTTVGASQFFFVPLMYDQNLRITDGTSSVDWTPSKKFFKAPLPHLTGFLTDEPREHTLGKAQELNLVLFTLGGAPVQLPVTTAAEDPELPDAAGSADGPKLRSSYPNPFTGTTHIGYNLPSFSQVNISVFDIMGRHVRTLVDAHQGAGVYEVRWDGTDATGAALPSGLYVYRLETESQTVAGSMLLTR